MKMKSVKFLWDEDVELLVEEFQKEFKEGVVPKEFLIPYLIVLGAYAYRRGMRMEPEIKL